MTVYVRRNERERERGRGRETERGRERKTVGETTRERGGWGAVWVRVRR